ncbi:uncharacterized protein LOC111891610 [Lactuca sativa]|uniref:uncharacterized protein LOC111891610 n=1 Tax=Lactuca sativa TaxID=4236 RepID=UPI0022AF29E6|nr:uncharacterized protein LOC111891610 [Lactuca sativa]
MDSKFSYDMNMEILSRTTLKTLDTMRCTNTEFEKLTYESYFLNLYKQRNNIVSGFLVQNLRKGCKYINEFAPSCESHSLDLGFLPPNAKILASSEQGFIVFESPHPRDYKLVSYHVCKPTTKEVLTLPNPKTRYLTKNVAILVVGSKPLHYKIVRLSEPKKPVLRGRDKLYTTYKCEIFDSMTWEWRLLDLVILPFGVFLTNQQAITTRGSIYMPLSNNDVLKFEAYSEKWTTFSLPIQTLEYPFGTTSHLIKFERKLGFAYRTTSHLWELWVLTNDESWERVHVFDTRSEDNGISSLDAIYDSDTRVMREYEAIAFYRFKGGDHIKKIGRFNCSQISDWLIPSFTDSRLTDFIVFELSIISGAV